MKKLNGTFRADRAAPGEPTSLGLPGLPRWIKNKDARAEFKRLSRMLNNMGVVGEVDSNELTRYVTTWVRWRRTVEALEKKGEEVSEMKSANGSYMQVSALHSAERSLADQLARLAASFGMTPSARTRISVNQAEREAAPGDAVLGFIGRKNG
jgi:P27 family predicted phage terminase small subunit